MNALVTTVAQPTLTAHAVVLMLTTTAAWCATRPNTRRGRRGPSRRAGGPPPGPLARLAGTSVDLTPQKSEDR